MKLIRFGIRKKVEQYTLKGKEKKKEKKKDVEEIKRCSRTSKIKKGSSNHKRGKEERQDGGQKEDETEGVE